MYHGTEIISNLGPKVWDLVPSNLKEICSLDKFINPLNNGNLRIVLVDCAKFCAKCRFSGKNNLKKVVN